MRIFESTLNCLPSLPLLTQCVKAVRELGAAVAAASAEPDEEGWRRVTIPIESIPHAAAQVLRLGAQAEVLKPAALLRADVDRVEAVLALYA